MPRKSRAARAVSGSGVPGESVEKTMWGFIASLVPAPGHRKEAAPERRRLGSSSEKQKWRVARRLLQMIAASDSLPPRAANPARERGQDLCGERSCPLSRLSPDYTKNFRTG